MDINKLMAEAVKLSVNINTQQNPIQSLELYSTQTENCVTGAHEYFGGPHAEVNCIDKVDPELKRRT